MAAIASPAPRPVCFAQKCKGREREPKRWNNNVKDVVALVAGHHRIMGDVGLGVEGRFSRR